MVHLKALKKWRLACVRVRVRWAAATLLLAPLAWTTPVQDGRESFLPNAAQPPTPAEQRRLKFKLSPAASYPRAV